MVYSINYEKKTGSFYDILAQDGNLIRNAFAV